MDPGHWFVMQPSSQLFAVLSCPGKPSACREKETGTGEILTTKGTENHSEI